MTLPELLPVLRESPTIVFAVLVWWELRKQSAELRGQSAALAVLIDRTGRRGPKLELVNPPSSGDAA